jgi:hypothetical protein
MAPTDRPLPRFIAEPPHELEPYGRWGDRLAEAFMAACDAVEDIPEGASPGEIAWYPERSWCGRTFVPASAIAGSGLEFYGYVSFRRADNGEQGRKKGEAADFRAIADFTDETAGQNPHWKIDLSDEVIGHWRGPGDARGDVTLVWGVPVGTGMAGAEAVTADLGGETVDQCGLGQARRFTLVALDAVSGMGPDALYLEIKLWGKRSEPIAVESLYEAE